MQIRARRQRDKDRRRQDILGAARTLFAETDFAEFTMSGVASRTGLVKGTLYLYFPTKEALLLELLEALLAEWFDDVDRQLARPGRWYARRAARVLATSLSQREPFARLLSIHGAILEHNIDEERARRFKRLTLERIGATGELLARRLPFLGRDGGVRLMLQASALIMGWGQMAYPAPVVRRVLDGAEFSCFRFDLAREFATAIGAILDGFEARARPPRRRRS